MVKRDGAYTRSERIKDMRRFFLNFAAAENNPGTLPLRRTLAMFQLNTGLTKEKLTEYMRIIEDLGEIVVDESTDQIRVHKLET